MRHRDDVTHSARTVRTRTPALLHVLVLTGVTHEVRLLLDPFSQRLHGSQSVRRVFVQFTLGFLQRVGA